MSTWRLDRLSTEFVGPITVTRNGVPITGWTYALLRRGERPTSTAAINATPDTLSGNKGILIGPGTSNVLAAGYYGIWIRYSDNPEAPVLGPDDFDGNITVT